MDNYKPIRGQHLGHSCPIRKFTLILEWWCGGNYSWTHRLIFIFHIQIWSKLDNISLDNDRGSKFVKCIKFPKLTSSTLRNGEL